MQRVVPRYVDVRVVGLAVDWLDAHWDGPCDLPREIRECLSTRHLVGMQRGKPVAMA